MTDIVLIAAAFALAFCLVATTLAAIVAVNYLARIAAAAEQLATQLDNVTHGGRRMNVTTY